MAELFLLLVHLKAGQHGKKDGANTNYGNFGENIDELRAVIKRRKATRLQKGREQPIGVQQ